VSTVVADQLAPEGRSVKAEEAESGVAFRSGKVPGGRARTAMESECSFSMTIP
jgi:hypothetical protein